MKITDSRNNLTSKQNDVSPGVMLDYKEVLLERPAVWSSDKSPIQD